MGIIKKKERKEEKKIDQPWLRLGSLAVQVAWTQGRTWLMENPDFINILKGSPFQLFISRDQATLPFCIRFLFLLYSVQDKEGCILHLLTHNNNTLPASH